jgi:hypothetical protein
VTGDRVKLLTARNVIPVLLAGAFAAVYLKASPSTLPTNAPSSIEVRAMQEFNLGN